VAKLAVDVMLKPEILDPQGQAVQRALPRMGFDTVTSVRQGKRFELELDDADPQTLHATASAMAEKLLANTVIEDFKVTVLDAAHETAEL
jgi:phosphoribosylformylglycinamidine synthase subunit PurS